MRRKSAGGRPRPLRVLRGGKANCSRFHCSSVRSVGYKVVFCILPYSKPRLDIRCPRTQKDQKMIFQTRSKGPDAVSALTALCFWLLPASDANAEDADKPTPDKSGYNLFHPTPRDMMRELGA